MRRLSLLFLAIVVAILTVNAQVINVIGGPGRVNNNTVIEGLPFTAQVVGLNGTPQRWAVGIGTVSGQTIFNTSSTVITNAVVNRTISGSTALISVGATNGRGVSRFLNVQNPPPECDSEVRFLLANDCNGGAAFLNPVPVGATGYSWSVSPRISFTNNGSSIRFGRLDPFDVYTVTVTVRGGVCNGETITNTFITRGCGDDILPFSSDLTETPNGSNLKVSPNPSNGSDVTLTFNGASDSFEYGIFSSEGLPVEGLTIQQKSVNEVSVDVRSLKPGIYFVKSVNEDGVEETQRFIIN